MVQRLERGEPLAVVARALTLSTTTVRRWWRRYQAEGAAGLVDRRGGGSRFEGVLRGKRK